MKKHFVKSITIKLVATLLFTSLSACGNQLNNITTNNNTETSFAGQYEDSNSYIPSLEDMEKLYFAVKSNNTEEPEVSITGDATVIGNSNNSLPSIYYTTPVELTQSKQLPANMKVMNSMNNVGLIKHEGRYYMGFRTAPSHFASTETLMHVMSSDDGERWQLERTLHVGADMREPNFLSFKGKLFFYFFKGGTNSFKFEPQEMYVMEKTDSGWTDPETFFEPGYVNWRPRVFNGKAYMSVYYGRDLYGKQENSKIYLLTSEDGRNWTPISEEPQVTGYPGAEEPEYEFDKEGNIYGTIRLESNGGITFFAPKDNLGKWELHKVKEKYDSALMMRHGDEMYLIARRNVDGDMDKAPKFLPEALRKWLNLLRYSLTKKRTALYHFDKEEMKVNPLFDFPSHGDTAFPAIAPINNNQYLFLNYSSELGIDKDYSWIKGQLKKTRLYSHILTFSTPNN